MPIGAGGMVPRQAEPRIDQLARAFDDGAIGLDRVDQRIELGAILLQTLDHLWREQLPRTRASMVTADVALVSG